VSRWFRHYAGMMRDDKLVRVAIRSKQPIERVAWIWGAILESAAEIDNDGRYDVDAAEVAYFLRADQADVDAILDSFAAAGRLAKGRVVKWGNLQFSSDRSKERVAAHRQRKQEERNRDNDRGKAGNADVTLQECHGNSPETETETEDTPIVPRKRGRCEKSLIPEDWAPPPVSELPPRSKALAQLWTDASYQTEAEAFVCYWRSERKMKGNWRDTWCNRVVSRHEAVMRAQKFGNAAPVGPAKTAKTPREWRELADWYDRHTMTDRAEECRKVAINMERRGATTAIGELAVKIARTA
jgi:hypothetical protein